MFMVLAVIDFYFLTLSPYYKTKPPVQWHHPGHDGYAGEQVRVNANLPPLLRPRITYDVFKAYRLIDAELIARL